VYVAFHDEGYTVYSPAHCHVQHTVAGSFEAFGRGEMNHQADMDFKEGRAIQDTKTY